MNEMTEAEKWRARDSATHTLSIIISNYSARMSRERKKDAPNRELMAQWLDEQIALSRLKRSLRIEDMATIARVNETYGPRALDIVKQVKKV